MHSLRGRWVLAWSLLLEFITDSKWGMGGSRMLKVSKGDTVLLAQTRILLADRAATMIAAAFASLATSILALHW
jgi:hypothetical protein